MNAKEARREAEAVVSDFAPIPDWNYKDFENAYVRIARALFSAFNAGYTEAAKQGIAFGGWKYIEGTKAGYSEALTDAMKVAKESVTGLSGDPDPLDKCIANAIAEQIKKLKNTK